MENQRLKELAGLITEKKWSGDVKTKWNPPEGFFTKGHAEIVKGLLAAPGGRAKAMSRLNFYINRSGKNLSDEDKAKLEKAKKKLEAMKEEVEAVARRAGLLTEAKKHDDDEDADMDMDGGGEAPKGDDEEETLPKIVRKIAKKAVGKDEEELCDLLMKVYNAGHKDGCEETEAAKAKKVKEAQELAERHHVKKNGKVTKKGSKAECDKHAEENGGEVVKGDAMTEEELNEKHHVKKGGKVTKKGTKAECDAHAEKNGGDVMKGEGEPMDEELEDLDLGNINEDWAEVKNALAKVRTDRVRAPCMTPAGKGTIEAETVSIPAGDADPKAGPYDHTVTVRLNSGKKGSFPAGNVKLFKGQKPSNQMFGGDNARNGGAGIANADKAVGAKATQQNEPGKHPKTTGSFLDKA